jgi:hypothetical protein
MTKKSRVLLLRSVPADSVLCFVVLACMWIRVFPFQKTNTRTQDGTHACQLWPLASLTRTKRAQPGMSFLPPASLPCCVFHLSRLYFLNFPVGRKRHACVYFSEPLTHAPTFNVHFHGPLLLSEARRLWERGVSENCGFQFLM